MESLNTMSPLYVEPGNSNQEGRMSDINLLGFSQEMDDFKNLCEEHAEDWHYVSREKQREPTLVERLEEKTRLLEASWKPDHECDKALQEAKIEDSLEDLTITKRSARELYNKHRGGRKNVREERRHACRERLQKRREKAMKVNRKDIEPHGENVEEKLTDDCELLPEDFVPGIEFEMSEETKERNKMAHIAASVDQFDKNDSELADLLSTVGEARSFADEAQFGEEIDEWIGHLENLVILGYHLGKSKNFMDMFMAVAAYAKMYTKKQSIVMELYRIINEITITCKQEEVEPQAWEEWTGRSVMEKWDLFKTNTIFKKISYLISAAMSLTVCTTKKIEWSPMGLKLISLEAAKEQLAAVDVIDALVKTFVWMCEVGWRCFETKSLAPILYSDNKVQKYNEECDWVLAKAEAAVAGNLDDLGDFETKLNRVLKQTCVMKAAKNEGPTSLWLQKRYSELTAITEKLIAKRKNTDIRLQPLGFSLHGATSVGKTTLGKLTMNQALAAMDYCDDKGVVDESRILTMDLFDKYNSTWTSDILGVFMDDVGNAKADFQKDNPHTSVIIKFFNNVAAQAIKAELNAKGVVFIDFKVGIITTNTKDLDARCYSNCPESILRRFFHVEVSVKEKFRKLGTSMLDKSHPEIRNSTSLTLDVWDLKIEEIMTFETGPNKTGYNFKILEVKMDDGSVLVCEKLGLKDYLRAVIQLSRVHKAEQMSLLEKSRKSSKTQFCQHCKQYPEFCECVTKEEIEPAAAEYIVDIVKEAGTKAITSYIESWTKPIDLINSLVGYSPIKKMATNSLAKEIQREMNNTGTPLLIAITPEWLFRTRVFQKSIAAWRNGSAYYDIRQPMRMLGFLGLSTIGLGAIKRDKNIAGAGFASLWCTTCIGYYMHQQRVRTLEEEYLHKRDALPAYAQQVRDGKFPKSVLFVATLALGVKIISMWNTKRVKDLEPAALTPEDIEKQPSWFGFMMERIGWKAVSSVVHATPEHVLATGQKNLWWADFERSDGTKTGCNVVCLEKGIIWFPLHIFYPGSNMTLKPCDWLKVTCYRDEKKKTSKVSFLSQLNVNTVTDPRVDMVACFVPNCPDVSKQLYRFLPLNKPTGTSACTLMSRTKEAKIVSESIVVKHCMTGHKYKEMYGGTYSTQMAESGTCMSLIVPEGKDPVVMGFHIGGAPSKNFGIMMTITQSMASEMTEMLYLLPGVRGLAHATELPKTQYGKQLIASAEIHPNALFIHELDEEARIDVLGSTKIRSQMKSRVVPSILSESVTRHFGVPNTWGPPKLDPNWKGFNATLEHIVNPSEPFLPSLLERARQDWLKPLIPFAKDLHAKEGIAPLNKKEMVLGVDGKRFLDAVPMNTGMGFPVFGPKKNWFTEVREGEKLIDRIPHQEVLDEMDRMYQCWDKGVRAYPVTTATLKDEATPVDSTKVRVFQAVAISFGLHIRKYFLPIARILSLCPELSESAVGVNAFGPQWDDLMKHAEKFAEGDRVIAWDYSKYDVRMNSQMTYAVLQSFIDIASVCGYSKQDLKIMNMMVADMIHPLIDYNGTMIMAYNMNTSGNNITVNINGAAGSLYVRMGFFHLCPKEKDFRSKIAAMTYGDDFIGSVHPSVRGVFNFLPMKKFLGEHKIKITWPDKSDTAEADMDIKDADFLKRKSNYIPEIGTRIGCLKEESILKPCHSVVKSKTETPKTTAIACLETASHEYFAHGREVYEDRQKKLQKVCEDLGIHVPSVYYSFDDRVQSWKEKYKVSGNGEEAERQPLFTFSNAINALAFIAELNGVESSDSDVEFLDSDIDSDDESQ